MNLRKFKLHHIIGVLIIFLALSGCTKEDICTEKVNVPIWNKEKQIFEDNFQDFPCGFKGMSKSALEFTPKET